MYRANILGMYFSPVATDGQALNTTQNSIILHIVCLMSHSTRTEDMRRCNSETWMNRDGEDMEEPGDGEINEEELSSIVMKYCSAPFMARVFLCIAKYCTTSFLMLLAFFFFFAVP